MKTNKIFLIFTILIFSCNKSKNLVAPIKEIFPDCKLIEEITVYKDSINNDSIFRTVYEYESDKLSKRTFFSNDEVWYEQSFKYAEENQLMYKLNSDLDTIELYQYQDNLLISINRYYDYPKLSTTIKFNYQNGHIRSMIVACDAIYYYLYTTDDRGNITSCTWDSGFQIRKENTQYDDKLNPKYLHLAPLGSSYSSPEAFNLNQNNIIDSDVNFLSNTLYSYEYNDNRLPSKLTVYRSNEIISITTFKYDYE